MSRRSRYIQQKRKIHKNNGSNKQGTENTSGTKSHPTMPLHNFGLTNLMVWRQNMDNKKKDIDRIKAFEMNFTFRTTGYAKRDHKINEDILDKLKIKPVLNYIQNYQRKWKEYVNRMNTRRIPGQILCHQL
jgi:hypothetical protein